MIKRTENEVLSDPTTSHWLKTALTSSADRDPADALNDAAQLLSICEARLEAAFAANAGKEHTS